jgi:hypothetical protein
MDKMQKKIIKFFLLLVIIAVLLISQYYRFINSEDTFKNLQNNDRLLNIFFIESNPNREYFDYRQLCSIESAAKHNPHIQIYVKSVKAKFENEHIMKKYANIKLEHINVTDILTNTSLSDWWLKKRLSKIPYFSFAQASNALRYAIVYSQGGMYADLDTVFLKNCGPLLNYSGFFFEEPNGFIGNSFFVATRKHPFLSFLMDKFVIDFKADVWGISGPKLITKYLPIYCKANSNDMLVNLNRKNDCNLVTFPYAYAHAVKWSDAHLLFQSNYTFDMQRLANSYSIHFASYMTKQVTLSWNLSNAYEILAAINCPCVYAMASQTKAP